MQNEKQNNQLHTWIRKKDIIHEAFSKVLGDAPNPRSGTVSRNAINEIPTDIKSWIARTARYFNYRGLSPAKLKIDLTREVRYWLRHAPSRIESHHPLDDIQDIIDYRIEKLGYRAGEIRERARRLKVMGFRAERRLNAAKLKMKKAALNVKNAAKKIAEIEAGRKALLKSIYV